MTLAEAVVKFKSEGVDSVVNGINKVGSAMENNSKKAQDFTNSIANIATGNIIGDIALKLGQGIFNLGVDLFKAGIAAESADARFTAFGLNALKTRDFLTRVSTSSALTSNQLNELALGLQQAGFNIYAVIPRLAKWSDAIGGGSEKLQGMLRLLNLLRSGVKPDQELLQSLGFSDILVKSGLKFDQGKLIGGIRPAMEAVMKEIDRMTGNISTQMAKTFEARLANLIDFVDKIKETIGRALIDLAGPIVDSLNVALGAVIRSNVLKKTLDGFFAIGKDLTKNIAKGMNNPEAQAAMSNLIATLLANFQSIPATLTVVGQMAVKIFKYIADGIQVAIVAGEKFNALLSGDFERLSELNAMPAPTAPKLDLTRETSQLQQIRGVVGEIRDEYRNSLLKEFQKGPGAMVKAAGQALLPGATLGAGRDESADKKEKDKKDKKEKEKQTTLLDLIVQNTQKSNELTLRNLTYGGGQLAAQGISSVQMSSFSNVSSSQINASNDITRGVEKIVRGYSNSNNLNFSFRRS